MRVCLPTMWCPWLLAWDHTSHASNIRVIGPAVLTGGRMRVPLVVWPTRSHRAGIGDQRRPVPSIGEAYDRLCASALSSSST